MGCGCGKSPNVVIDGSKKSAHQGNSDFVSVPSTQSKGKQSAESKPSTVQNSHDLEQLPKAMSKEQSKPVPKPLPALKPKPELPAVKPEPKAIGELPPVKHSKATPLLMSASTQPKTDTSTSPQVPEPETEVRQHLGKSTAEPKLQTQKSLGRTELPGMSQVPGSIVKPEVRKEPESVPDKKPSGSQISEKKHSEPKIAESKQQESHRKSPEPVPEKSPENSSILSNELATPKLVPTMPNKASARSEEDKFPTQSSSQRPQPPHEVDILTDLVHTDLQALYNHVISSVDDQAEGGGGSSYRNPQVSREEAVRVLVREELQGLYERILRLRSEEDDPMAKNYLQGLYSRVLAD